MADSATTLENQVLRSEGALASGSVTLFHRSVRPVGKIVARLGVIHGYGDHSGRYEHLMLWLAQRGIAVSAFDLRGQGRSSGKRGFVVRWEDYLADLKQFLALDELRQGDRRPPLFLLGHSHGGLVLAAAVLRGIALPRGCVFTSPFFKSRMIVPRYKTLIARIADRVMPSLRVPSGIPGAWLSHDPSMREQSDHDPHVCKTATPRWWFTHQVIQHDVLASAREFALPMLLQWGGADPLADESAARHFFDRAASADKTFLRYPDMLHELLRETQRETVFEDLRRWIAERSE